MKQTRKEQTLKERVRKGIAAGVVGQIASQVISIGSLAVLMHMVAPAAYGLVHMLMPIIIFLRILATLGLNTAAVQKEGIEDEERSILFWWTLLGGTLATAFAAACAPIVADVYHHPEIGDSLTHLLWALSPMLLLHTLCAQHQAVLERRLEFKKLAYARIAGQATGAVCGVAAALAGLGVWALVVQQLSELVVLTAWIWIAAKWLPSSPRKCGWNFNGSKKLFQFGGLFAIASAVLLLVDQIDRILIGYWIDPLAVGLYGQAKNLMLKPIYLITTPLSAILLSAISRTREDAKMRETLLVQFYRMLAILLVPTAVGITMVGEQAMHVMGGGRWHEAGPLLVILSIGLFAQAVIIMNGWVLTAAGRADRLLIGAIAMLVILTQASYFGWILGTKFEAPTQGIAWGYTFTMFGVLLVPHTIFTFQTVGTPLLPVLKSMRRPLYSSFIMGMVMFALERWLLEIASGEYALQLATLTAAGSAVYAAIAWGELKWLLGFVLSDKEM